FFPLAMESHLINKNGDHDATEENPVNHQRFESQSQSPPLQPESRHRVVDEQSLFRFPNGVDLQTLASSLGNLSVRDPTVRQQNPSLWSNGSSSSSPINGGGSAGGGGGYWPRSPPYPHRETDSQQLMMSEYLQTLSIQNDYVNGGSLNGFLSGGDLREVPYLSRNRFLDQSRHHNGFGSIVSLAKERDSSNELQKKICVGSKETIDIVFNEVVFHTCELMVDPFGHHVFQRLMERCSNEQISQDQILSIVGAVSMAALTLTRSNNAKHVILLCFNEFSPSQNRILLEVIARNCYPIAIDQHGCCMLQQCLDINCNVLKQRLIREIIANSLRLCVNCYGNYVVQYVVELENPSVTIQLVRHLVGSYAYLSRNKYGSHAVQKLLNIQYIDTSRVILFDLLSDRDIDTLLTDPFGNYVIQTAWAVCKDYNLRSILVEHIRLNKPLMRCNRFGNKILEKLSL
ncbi:hypothetical protein EUTSA_v10003331mg, partial [Eutrema salsugineum]